MVYFLDTDVVINLRRQTPNRQLLDWLGITPKEEVRNQFVVIFEIQRGIETLHQEGKHIPTAEIETWLERLLDAAGPDGIVCPAVDDVRMRWTRGNIPVGRVVAVGVVTTFAYLRKSPTGRQFISPLLPYIRITLYKQNAHD